jgi:SAM-dependent methyltransferase
VAEKPTRRESVRDFYDRQYRFHWERGIDCPNALHDLDKARRRVAGVIRGFGVRMPVRAKVLDVGCGLGYYTKALSLAGGEVTGLDFSEAALASARRVFPECRFSYGTWPEDVEPKAEFDVIWMVNFSLMNTFDVDFINGRLIEEATRRLTPGGTLVVGWNSDFSGSRVDGYSHWSLSMIGGMRDRCGLSAPLVAEARTRMLSWFMIRCAATIRRSIPIFMAKRRADGAV